MTSVNGALEELQSHLALFTHRPLGRGVGLQSDCRLVVFKATGLGALGQDKVPWTWLLLLGFTVFLG